MRKQNVIYLLMLLATWCNAQTDTEPKVSDHTQEFGINISMVSNLILGGDGTADIINPYVITYKNISSSNQAFRMGLGLRLDFSEQKEQERKLSNTSFDFRLGYEKQYYMTERWLIYTGVDFLSGWENHTSKTDNFESKDRIWRIGLGPLFGIQWQINKHIGLSTELALYYLHTEEKETSSFGGNDQDSNKNTSNSMRFNLPSNIFLTIRF